MGEANDNEMKQALKQAERRGRRKGWFARIRTFILGIIIGMLCGFYGGIVDDILMRVADLMLAFPQMVVAIAVAGILGGGLDGAMIALGITTSSGVPV